MMCIDEINIGDIVCAGIYGYKVLAKDDKKHLVHVQAVCIFSGLSRKEVERWYYGGIYFVEPKYFVCKYSQKAVIL